MTFFKDLGLSEPILRALSAEGYETPTPIQAGSIPDVLAGSDFIGCAQTGTGKTAAFSLPIIEMLSNRRPQSGGRPIRCLVLTPTRELAIQVEESFRVYGKFCNLKCTVIFGGVGQGAQTDRLRNGVDVLVATPGRLLDLMSQGFVDLRYVEIFVLDEADRMLDMGFVHDVRKVIAKLPKQRQTLLFSATMPKEIVELARTILINPKKVEVTPVSSTAEKIAQKVYFVSKNNKRHLLAELLENPEMKQVLVFSRTKHGADKIVKDLERFDIAVEAIHGNKSQNARQRALKSFKDGTLRVLVATDIAARGIDIDSLGVVINYDLPNEPETYVHRIGRTGRAGASGISISFCDGEEREYLGYIERLIKKSIPVEHEHAYKTDDKEAQAEAKEAAVKRSMPKGRSRQFAKPSSGAPKSSESSDRQRSGKPPMGHPRGERPAGSFGKGSPGFGNDRGARNAGGRK